MVSRKARVTQPQTAESTNPLLVKVGDIIEGIQKPTKWAGWLWCHNKKYTYGWMPEAYLQPLPEQPGSYRVLKQYSSKEINLRERQMVEILVEESGWGWVRTTGGDEGWVPLEYLDEL